MKADNIRSVEEMEAKNTGKLRTALNSLYGKKSVFRVFYS